MIVKKEVDDEVDEEDERVDRKKEWGRRGACKPLWRNTRGIHKGEGRVVHVRASAKDHGEEVDASIANEEEGVF